MSTDDENLVVWSLPRGVTLRWQSWDVNEIIVYNRASGQTHYLDAFSAELLRQIEAEPRHFSEIAQSLAAELELDIEAVRARVRNICSSFVELGLAQSTPHARP